MKKQQEEAKVETKQKEQQDLLKRAHADEANSFAKQLREAYEKQLKARENAGSQNGKVAPASPAVVADEAAVVKPTKEKSPKVRLPRQPTAQKSRKTSPDSSTTGSKDSKSTVPKQNGANKDKPAKASKKSEPKSMEVESELKVNNEKDSQEDDGSQGSNRTEEEEAAGTILIGFLSSLRDSYEDAVRKKSPTDASEGQQTGIPAKKAKKRVRQDTDTSSKKQKVEETPKISSSSSVSKIEEENESKPKAKTTVVANQATVKEPEEDAQKGTPKRGPASSSESATSSLADSYRQFTAANIQSRRTTPAYVTDMSTSTSETSSGNNSTNPVESSLEDSDSNSDKCGDINSEKGKADPSSSEEDDKDMGESRDERFRSKGPPRKRLKSKKMTDGEQPRTSQPVAAQESGDQ